MTSPPSPSQLYYRCRKHSHTQIQVTSPPSPSQLYYRCRKHSHTQLQVMTSPPSPSQLYYRCRKHSHTQLQVMTSPPSPSQLYYRCRKHSHTQLQVMTSPPSPYQLQVWKAISHSATSDKISTSQADIKFSYNIDLNVCRETTTFKLYFWRRYSSNLDQIWRIYRCMVTRRKFSMTHDVIWCHVIDLWHENCQKSDFLFIFF